MTKIVEKESHEEEEIREEIRKRLKAKNICGGCLRPIVTCTCQRINDEP